MDLWSDVRYATSNWILFWTEFKWFIPEIYWGNAAPFWWPVREKGACPNQSAEDSCERDHTNVASPLPPKWPIESFASCVSSSFGISMYFHIETFSHFRFSMKHLTKRERARITLWLRLILAIFRNSRLRLLRRIQLFSSPFDFRLLLVCIYFRPSCYRTDNLTVQACLIFRVVFITHEFVFFVSPSVFSHARKGHAWISKAV